MKNLFKKSIGFMLSVIVAMQGIVTFAAEGSYKDGDIELCTESQIYVNETFSDATLPSGATANGAGSWKFSGSGAVLEESGLFLQGGVNSYAQFTLTSPLAGVGNKYVLSYDMNKDTIADANVVYGMSINSGKPIFLSPADDGTYAVRAGGAGTNVTLVSGIETETFVNIRLIITIEEAQFTADVIVSDANGTVLGKTEALPIAGYDAAGITKLLFGYVADNTIIDNVRLYDYVEAPEVEEPTPEEPTEPDEEEEPEFTGVDSEQIYTDGDFELCADSDIIVNETFQGDAVPNGDTADGLGTWKIRNSSLSEGSLLLPGGKNSYAQMTLKSPLTGVGNKYVISYDINRTAATNSFYGPNINGKKPFASFAGSGDVYNICAIGSATTKVAQNIPVGTAVNVKAIITIGESGLMADVTVKDMNGNVLGSAENLDILGYDATKTGFDTFLFGYATDDTTIDNFRVYKFVAVPKAGKITEPAIPGIPVPEGGKYLVNEDFDSRATIANKFTDEDGNYWTCPGGKSLPMVDMVSGRRVMKLADDIAWYTVTPSSPIAYSAEDGANNRYVIKFGYKYVQGTNESATTNLMRFNYSGGNKAPVYVLSNGDIKTLADQRYAEPKNDWLTVAAVIDVGETDTVMTVYLADGAYTNKYSKTVTIQGVNNIPTLQMSAAAGSTLYIDNLQIYKAGSELEKGQEPVTTAGNIKLTTASGDAVLKALSANTEVFVSADFKTANTKPVQYVPLGIFAAYKKLSDGSLKLVATDYVTLNDTLRAGGEKVTYAPEKALFTSDSEGGEYVVNFLMWKDMENIEAYSDAVVFAE